MPTLRITQSGPNIEAAFEGDGQPRQTETRPFSFQLALQDAEDIRWYLEDYLVYPVDPLPKTAARIERRLREIGQELFRGILHGSDVWSSAKQRLEETRVEVESDIANAVVPWELLCPPDLDQPLALHVPAFVRGHSGAALRPKPVESSGKIRILLAICRPGGADDVPFRSVARRLISGLNQEAREHFDLEVLRPPTFERLSKRLREVKSRNQPFHVVHFDGHGTSGVVLFENPKLGGNAEQVKAEDLGKLLRETGVPVLILNACRSAHSEPPQQPEPASDVHQQIRVFGSLAHAVMDYGASGVVAWRYKVFVLTAAQFMADLYAALASGQSLGEAATMARKQLNSKSRPTGPSIEDWTVPVVFESAPVRLFAPSDGLLKIELESAAPAESGLPRAPDIGFIGRDETILKLDRMFDEQSIVLLHAYAGSGKTSTAAEFARWYRETGGLGGPVLFTSFDPHRKPPQVLDQLGQMFEPTLEKSGIHWLTLTDDQRRSVALQVLKKTPMLWIWNNVEPVTGFPKGTPSLWTAEEQKELADFLADARATKAKFLLTSRRDERDWLHDLPGRVELPPMPIDERVQMTAELAKKHGRHLEDVEDWRPLLQFTQGNPLTLTVLVGQALRDGLRSRGQIEEFLCKLRAGEARFHDDKTEGRERSLAASLEYGFENAFNEPERKQLALLHLFHGFVEVDALRTMGHPEAGWRLPEVTGLTREAGIALLDRAAEVGLLTALGEGCYAIHPALPWFFRRPFDHYYAANRLVAMRAFVEATGLLGNYYHREYNGGNRNVIRVLSLEETNLLNARALARTNRWWPRVIATMQGLHVLYRHSGRRAEWARLVEEIVPDFVDPATEGPLHGREEGWGFVTDYRVRLEIDARRWKSAQRLQELVLKWVRDRAAAALAKPPEALDAGEKNHVHALAVSLERLANIQRDQGLASCVENYREALSHSERVGDLQQAAICAFNLGNAFMGLKKIRDLPKAEQCYRRSLDLTPEGDRLNRAQCLGQLGSVAYERFREARGAGRPTEELSGHLREAERGYKSALKMLPSNGAAELAATHAMFGNIYGDGGQPDRALDHYRQSIRYREAMGDRFEAGRTRYNAAVFLARAGRFSDALDWARTVLRDFEAAGGADQEILRTAELIRRIESGPRGPSPQP